jgi:hypothetical protein
MPVYEFKVYDADGNPTNEVIEKQFKWSDRPKQLISSEGRIAKLIVSAPARTSVSWSDSCGTRYGVNGYYNRGLGVRVSSEAEADKIAASRGLVRLDNYDNKHLLEDNVEAVRENDAREDREYASLMKQYETWTSG